MPCLLQPHELTETQHLAGLICTLPVVPPAKIPRWHVQGVLCTACGRTPGPAGGVGSWPRREVSTVPGGAGAVWCSARVAGAVWASVPLSAPPPPLALRCSHLLTGEVGCWPPSHPPCPRLLLAPAASNLVWEAGGHTTGQNTNQDLSPLWTGAGRQSCFSRNTP